MDYTVEVYKRDARTKAGERQVEKYQVVRDDDSISRMHLKLCLESQWKESYGYRVVIHKTFVTRKNLLSGQEFQERYDTPSFCSPSSESFWSN